MRKILTLKMKKLRKTSQSLNSLLQQHKSTRSIKTNNCHMDLILLYGLLTYLLILIIALLALQKRAGACVSEIKERILMCEEIHFSVM